MKDVSYYMSLPYTADIRKIADESGTYYYARMMELDGCQSVGETFAEAYKNLIEATRGWIETKLEAGCEIPLPKGRN